jgi:hypothetical protein
MAACVLANADVSTVAMSDLAKMIMDDFQSSVGVGPDGEAFALAPPTVSIGPNPVTASGTIAIRIWIPRDGWVRLQAFDVGGRIVSTLANGRYPAGAHDIAWRPGNDGLVPGVYFVRLSWPGAADVSRVVVAE